MKLDKLHSINGAYWQESKGRNETKQYRLTGSMSGQKTVFGHRVESQAAIIDRLLLQGRFTIEEMAVNAKYKSGKIAVSRVRQHLYAKLRDKLGLDICTDSKGRVYAANVTTSNENHNLLLANEAAKQAASEQAKVKHVRSQAAIKAARTKAARTKAARTKAVKAMKTA